MTLKEKSVLTILTGCIVILICISAIRYQHLQRIEEIFDQYETEIGRK